VDVRLVAATHSDLPARVRDGTFREDLYFRLNVFHIRLPPLRDRRGDVPLLVEHALREAGVSATTVSPLAMRALLAHPWPGNVRQLLSALESARIRSDGGPIQAHHLPEEVRAKGKGLHGPESVDDRYRKREDDDTERARIEAALAEADGVRVRAAELLGMGRTTLWRKMREYGLEEG
jgi:DNA-binding NtrC family response regulator